MGSARRGTERIKSRRWETSDVRALDVADFSCVNKRASTAPTVWKRPRQQRLKPSVAVDAIILARTLAVQLEFRPKLERRCHGVSRLYGDGRQKGAIPYASRRSPDRAGGTQPCAPPRTINGR